MKWTFRLPLEKRWWDRNMFASQQVTKSTVTNLLIRSFCKLYFCFICKKCIVLQIWGTHLNPKKSYVFDWNSITSRCSFQKSCRQQQINSVLFIYLVLEVELLQKRKYLCKFGSTILGQSFHINKNSYKPDWKENV